ncbi:hypothetical protein PMAYCL1PPCAC_14331 [Pristionchus mayeri]|uniref:Uncharacterized protein n=1 Tax=Pristionchus mayeri TaxID=1317129 RepID=A0AAN5CHG5_9BILA|nr:hypothetical protein PMAYCL1PPCAC_14331 [Pristionchus mayeri]
MTLHTHVSTSLLREKLLSLRLNSRHVVHCPNFLDVTGDGVHEVVGVQAKGTKLFYLKRSMSRRWPSTPLCSSVTGV